MGSTYKAPRVNSAGQGLGELMAIMSGGGQQAMKKGYAAGQMQRNKEDYLSAKADIAGRQNNAQMNLGDVITQYIRSLPGNYGPNVSNVITQTDLAGGGNAQALGTNMGNILGQYRQNQAINDPNMDPAERARIMAFHRAAPTVRLGPQGQAYGPYATPGAPQIDTNNPVTQAWMAHEQRQRGGGADTGKSLSPLARSIFQIPVMDSQGKPALGLNGQQLYQPDLQMAAAFLQFWQQAQTTAGHPLNQDDVLPYFLKSNLFHHIQLQRAVGLNKSGALQPAPGGGQTTDFSHLWGGDKPAGGQ